MSDLVCPRCSATFSHIVQKGFYERQTGAMRRIQKYYCKSCRRFFSDQTGTLSFKDKRPDLNQPVYRIMNSSVSQRKAAFIFGVHPDTIALKMRKLSIFARRQVEFDLTRGAPVTNVTFDEMETFEHTKCKPLSIVVAVEDQTRKILSLRTCPMPASGRLAEISRNKYGPRPDLRSKTITNELAAIKPLTSRYLSFKSDMCMRYPVAVKEVYGKVPHETFKSRKARVIGQGELKVGGFDPIFSVNHTCAMIRDNVKRLSRKTWCVTKKEERLQDMLYLYWTYHNQRLLNKKRRPTIDEGNNRVKIPRAV